MELKFKKFVLADEKRVWFKLQNESALSQEMREMVQNDTIEILDLVIIELEDDYSKNFPVVCLVSHSWIDTSDYGYEPWYEDYKKYTPISYDPFTGEKIVITIESEEDITEKYRDTEEKIAQLRTKISKLSHRHSSKKKELVNELRELERRAGDWHRGLWG